MELVQEVDDLLERGVLGQVLDRIPDVPQAAVRPVDVGDLCLGGDDLAESLVGHARLLRGARYIPGYRGGPTPNSDRMEDEGDHACRDADPRGRRGPRGRGGRSSIA